MWLKSFLGNFFSFPLSGILNVAKYRIRCKDVSVIIISRLLTVILIIRGKYRNEYSKGLHSNSESYIIYSMIDQSISAFKSRKIKDKKISII